MTVLQQLSDALAATVETAGASTVRVAGRKRLAATGIVWSADGVIVAAHHTLRQDEGIKVTLGDGRELDATLVGRDVTTDLALLRVAASDLTPAKWADPASIKVGHLALALGRPGQTVQATLGVVSALGEGWRTPAGGEVERYLQTDVVMYPGFSGGPLVGADGQVLGLNTSDLLRGVSLALPLETVQRVAEALLTHGRVRRGYLGVGVQTVRLPEGVAEGQETGVLVTSVEKNSPAGQAGLVLGDTLLVLDGEPVTDPDSLLALLTGSRVDKTVDVRVLRGGALQTVRVTIGERA